VYILKCNVSNVIYKSVNAGWIYPRYDYMNVATVPQDVVLGCKVYTFVQSLKVYTVVLKQRA